MWGWRLHLGIGAVVAAGCVVAPTGPTEQASIVVGFDASADRMGLVAAVGGTVDLRLEGLNAWVVRVPGATAEAALAQLASAPGVRYAEQDGRRVAAGESDFNPFAALPWLVEGGGANDPFLGSQWGLQRVQAPAAWAVSRSAPEVLIAVLDSGIDQDHPDLQPKLAGQKTFSNSPTLDDRLGHGTHVAGIAAAATDNGIGVAGAGYNARLLNVKVMTDHGSTQFTWSALGIQWAADQGAKVINMSYGSAAKSQVERDAIAYAAKKGAVLVSIAGNKGGSDPSYPGAYPEVIAVGGTTSDDQRSSVSGYGANWVDVAAPGEGIYSTLPNHLNGKGRVSYGTLGGTSMSAAFVSGEAALLWPGSSNAEEVRRRIESTCDPVGKGRLWAHGRVNFRRALSQ